MKKSIVIKSLALLGTFGLLFTACTSTHRHDRDYSHYPRTSPSAHTSDYSSWEKGSVTKEGSGAQPNDRSQTRNQVQDQIDIPLHKEQLSVGKQTVDSGQVTIRKIVTTETVNQPIQLRKESLVIDRDYSGSQNTAAANRSSQSDSEWKPGANNDSSKELSASAKAGSAQAELGVENDANEPAGANYQNRNTSANSSGNAFQEETFTIRLQEEQPIIQKNIVQTGRVTARKNSQMQQQNISQQVRREEVKLDRSQAQNVEIRGNFNTAGGQINEPAGAERRQSQDSQFEQRGVQENRSPTQGQGAADLKNLEKNAPVGQPDQNP